MDKPSKSDLPCIDDAHPVPVEHLGSNDEMAPPSSKLTHHPEHVIAPCNEKIAVLVAPLKHKQPNYKPAMKPSGMTPEFLEPRTKTSRKVRIAFNRQVAAHGLPYPRARTLFSVAKKQNMYQIELACDLELEPATMVHILDRIEENGLIERRPDARDRRVNLIVLTPIVEEQAALATSIGRTCA